MDDRLARVEAALDELRLQNQQLQLEVQELRGQLANGVVADTAPSLARGRARWTPLFLVLGLVVIPVIILTLWNVNAFWSATVGAVNGILFYLVGPKAIQLFIEGLFRAIPGIVLGQTTRIAVDTVRQRKTRSNATALASENRSYSPPDRGD